jgi:hypothetical protein
VVPERLAGVDVAQVHLDERNAYGEQRVAQRDARVGEPGRIEQNECDMARGRQVDATDQLGFGIALERAEPMARLGGELRQALVDLLEGHVPIEPGLPRAQQVQVRTIEQEQVGHGPQPVMKRARV